MEKARHDAVQPTGLPDANGEPTPPPEECEKIAARFQAQAVEQYEEAAGVLEEHLAAVRADAATADAAGAGGTSEICELLAEVRAKVEEVAQMAVSAEGVMAAGGEAAGVTTIGFGADAGAGVSSSSSSSSSKRPMAELGTSTTTIGFGEGTTTIGFGETTIGFGNAGGAGGGSSMGFAAPATGAPVKDLGVVGRGSKRVKLD